MKGKELMTEENISNIHRYEFK